MTDAKSLTPRSPSRRKSERRRGPAERRTDGAAATAVSAQQTLPAVIPGAPRIDRVAADPEGASPAVFAAQMLGQDGQKRGLRGGRETLDKAKASYLGVEWSGAADRRPRAGKIAKTDI